MKGLKANKRTWEVFGRNFVQAELEAGAFQYHMYTTELCSESRSFVSDLPQSKREIKGFMALGRAAYLGSLRRDMCDPLPCRGTFFRQTNSEIRKSLLKPLLPRQIMKP